MNEEAFMRLAIEIASQGIAAGQSPFGAVIIQGDRLVSSAHNTVWQDVDPSAHAEVNAIRRAATQMRDIKLRGCVMFTTCEPCPMCLAAIHWSKIDRVVYGAEIADASAAGFSELQLSAKDLARLGRSPLIVEGGLLREDCRQLFEQWLKSPGKKVY